MARGGGVLSDGGVDVLGVVDGEVDPLVGGGAGGAVVVDPFPDGPGSAIATAAPTRKAAPARRRSGGSAYSCARFGPHFLATGRHR